LIFLTPISSRARRGARRTGGSGGRSRVGPALAPPPKAEPAARALFNNSGFSNAAGADSGNANFSTIGRFSEPRGGGIRKTPTRPDLPSAGDLDWGSGNVGFSPMFSLVVLMVWGMEGAFLSCCWIGSEKKRGSQGKGPIKHLTGPGEKKIVSGTYVRQSYDRGPVSQAFRILIQRTVNRAGGSWGPWGDKPQNPSRERAFR